MSPVGSPSAQHPAQPVRHRRNVRKLTTGQLRDFRAAITAAQAISDDRGYQYHAGIHGLPLPMYCKHGSPLFLPWHRAYLYFFELALQDRVDGVTLPWWDWTVHHGEGLPRAYSARDAEGERNPLHSSPIQRAGRNGGPSRTRRSPGSHGMLPSGDDIERLLELGDFLDFQTQLEDIHNGIHVWVGGTMSDIGTAAYDPVFWAHHAMIDRAWRLWQIRHPDASPPASLLRRALPPFEMTVEETLDTNTLGYDYASSTAAAAGTGGA